MNFSVIFATLIFGLTLIGICYKNSNFVLAGFGLIIFAFGVYLFQAKYSSIINNVLIKNGEQSAVIIGQIIREPQLGYKNQRLIVSVKKLILNSGQEIFNNREIGKILIYTNNYAEYKYLEQIKAKGKIYIPKMLDSFDYQGYLAKEGIVATLAYPEIEVLNLKEKLTPFQFFYSKILFFKELMRKQTEQNLDTRAGAVNQAMILGDSQMMPDELKQKLSQSGLSHAIAISGAHIVLFSLIVFEILLFFGLWKKPAASITLCLIAGYVILVGSMASAVRSGIMAGLLMLAQLFDRTGENERLLGLAGFFILLQNPLALKYDLGFQLSFLAMVGLFWLAPFIKTWLFKKFKERWSGLIEVLAATLAAQIFTLPILAFNFGYISAVSLFSNLLVAPLMPVLMVFGLAFPLAGLISAGLGSFLAFFAALLLKYLLLIVALSASAPFAVFNFKINVWLMGLAYSAVFGLVIWRKKRVKNFEFLP